MSVLPLSALGQLWFFLYLQIWEILERVYTSARVACSDRGEGLFDGNLLCRGWSDCMIGDIVLRCDINGSGNSTGLLIKRLKVAFRLLRLLGLGTGAHRHNWSWRTLIPHLDKVWVDYICPQEYHPLSHQL